MSKIQKISIFSLLFLLVAGTALAAEDPYYIKEWYLPAIKADSAWTVTKGNTDVIVAVIDTGVDLDQPDLKDNLWINADEIAGDKIDNDRNGYVDDVHGWNFYDKNNDPQPNLKKLYDVFAASHGTFIAGVISAVHDNSLGIKGVTAHVKIMPILALDGTGDGTSEAVSEAVKYAVKNGADVINLSFGGREKSTALKNAISDAYAAGVVVVAASGNAGNGGLAGIDMTDDPLYPICYDKDFTENKIIGVAASGKTGKLSVFTNYGKGCIDIAAPGEEIVSLLYQDSSKPEFVASVYDSWKGSSFSAAIVSGAAALLKSYKPSATPKQITDALLSKTGMLFLPNATYTGKAGQGVLNIKYALEYMGATVGSPGTVQPTTSTTATITPTTSINTASQFILSQMSGGAGTVKIFNSDFKLNDELTVFSGDKFHGLNISSADVDGDGVKELVAGAVKGDQAFVRVLKPDGTIVSSFLPFGSAFLGGLNVAAANLDDDTGAELIVAPQSGFSPSIKIFKQNGKSVREFSAYNIDYKNGVNVAAGDVDGDGNAEIVTAPKKGLYPKVKIFNANGVLKYEFTAYSAASSNGAKVFTADTNKDGKAEIIVSAESGDTAYVIVYDYKGVKKHEISPYPNFKGGVDVSAADWNNDGKTEIITSAGTGGGPHVKIFSDSGLTLGQFFAWTPTFTGGISVETR
jgi:hypothetical protein